MRKPIPELEMELTDAIPGFSCRKCARCCTGKLVTLYDEDLERLKRIVEVGRIYEKTTAQERILTGAEYKMIMENGRCILLKDGLCMHYDLRPDTCRRHPFLETERRILVASTCPGVIWNEGGKTSDYKKLSKGISEKIDAYLDSRD
jgi:Fe-S-cluster containining protein